MLRDGTCDSKPDFATALAGITLEPHGSLIGKCWATGLPACAPTIATEDSPVGASAPAAGLDTMVALPLIEAGRAKAIVALYF